MGLAFNQRALRPARARNWLPTYLGYGGACQKSDRAAVAEGARHEADGICLRANRCSRNHQARRLCLDRSQALFQVGVKSAFLCSSEARVLTAMSRETGQSHLDLRLLLSELRELQQGKSAAGAAPSEEEKAAALREYQRL